MVELGLLGGPGSHLDSSVILKVTFLIPPLKMAIHCSLFWSSTLMVMILSAYFYYCCECLSILIASVHIDFLLSHITYDCYTLPFRVE